MVSTLKNCRYLGEPREFSVDSVIPLSWLQARFAGVVEHILYTAVKIMRLRLTENSCITSKSTDDTANITRADVENRKFVESCIENATYRSRSRFQILYNTGRSVRKMSSLWFANLVSRISSSYWVLQISNGELQRGWIPIRATIQLNSKIISCKRTEFPLVEACAVIILLGGAYDTVMY